MNIKNTLLVTLAVMMLIPGGKLAAGVNNSIELTDEVGIIGGQVMIDIIWTNQGNATQTLQFDMLYNDTVFTFDSCPLNNPGNWVLPTCQVIGPGEIRLGLLDPDGLQNITVGTLILDVNGPAGMYQVTIEPGSVVTSDGEMTDTDPANIDVQAVPMPNYASTPPPGGTIDFGVVVENPGSVQQVLNIENDGLPTGGSFDATCSITNNPGGVYSLVSPMDGMFTLDIGEDADLTIACDTTLAGDYTGGVLSCDHDAPNPPDPALYTLDCVVTGDPVYGSNPAPGNPINFGSFPQNNPAPNQSLLINNDAGETGSILAGECSLMGGGTPIALVAGPTVMYQVLQGAADAVIGLSCDTTQAVGPYNDTLVCTNNDPLFKGDATYPVTCEILPPDPGMWGSNPVSGSTIDLTPGGPVLVGTDLTNAGQLSVFNTGEPGDGDIEYNCSIVSGSPEITQNPDPALGTLVAGGSADLLTYSCDSSAAGSFSAGVECAWSAPIEGAQGLEPYTVTCEVRDPFSEVVETPPSGTPQTAELSPGDSITFDFNFEEIIDEGLDGILENCALVSNTDFAIITSTVYPQDIPSGGPPLLVQVEFTDPGQGDTFTDTLNCTYTDNTDGGEPEQTQVSWPLEVNVSGRNARFRVTKDFDDDNP